MPVTPAPVLGSGKCTDAQGNAEAGQILTFQMIAQPEWDTRSGDNLPFTVATDSSGDYSASFIPGWTYSCGRGGEIVTFICPPTAFTVRAIPPAPLNSTPPTTSTFTGSVVGHASLDLAQANNLSDLANAATARTNLGLGSAATTSASAYDVAGAAAVAAAESLPAAGGTVTGTIGALSGAFQVQNIAGTNQIDLSSTNSGTTALVFQNHSSGNIFVIQSAAITNTLTITNASNTPLLTLNGTTKAVETNNNTLDDGSGNASFIGSLSSSINVLDNGSGDMIIGGVVQGASGSGPTLFTSVKGMAVSGTSVITTGVLGSVEIPFNCTVTKWAVISTDGTSGSIAFDVQQSSFGPAIYTNTPSNSIVGNGAGGVYPNLTGQTTNSSSTLTHWTTALTGGSYLVFVVTGTPTAIKNVRLELTLTPR